MCGIIGTFNYDASVVQQGLKVISNRGRDSSKIINFEKLFFGHNLHAVVDFVKQPIESSKGILVINCEIYNWKEMKNKYKIHAKNDAELVLKLIDKKGIVKITEIASELDGDFALAYFSKKDKKIVLMRDIVGVKPLVYSYEKDGFAFASEKKALPFNSVQLNPRKILIFDLQKNKIKFINLKINQKNTNVKIVQECLQDALEKRNSWLHCKV